MKLDGLVLSSKSHNKEEMRKENWVDELDALIESRRKMPHKWGSNDCCLFAADAVLAVTGEDKAAALRGTYSTQEEAQAIIAKYGDMTAFVSSFLGQTYGPLCGRQGDIVLFKVKDAEAVGVCTGTHFVCPGDSELIVHQMSKAIKSWKVD